MSRRRATIPPRQRIFLGCEGESEQGYGALLSRLAEEMDLSSEAVGEIAGT
jgi:hypothetical protein